MIKAVVWLDNLEVNARKPKYVQVSRVTREDETWHDICIAWENQISEHYKRSYYHHWNVLDYITLQLIAFRFPQVRTLKRYMSLCKANPNSERILYTGFPTTVQRAPNPLMCIQFSLDCHIRDFSDLFLCAHRAESYGLQGQGSIDFCKEY
jgi:hypothetical protein